MAPSRAVFIGFVIPVGILNVLTRAFFIVPIAGVGGGGECAIGSLLNSFGDQLLVMLCPLLVRTLFSSLTYTRQWDGAKGIARLCHADTPRYA